MVIRSNAVNCFKESNAFFSFQVISVYTENNNYFAELIPVVSVKDGKASQQFSTSDIASHRRKRASLRTTAVFQLRRSFKVGLAVLHSRKLRENKNYL